MSVPLIGRVRGRARGHGQHRAVDEVERLRRELQQVRSAAAACEASLRDQLRIAKAGWDKANAKASRAEDALLVAAEATRQNQTAVSSLTFDPAVTDTQPIKVITLAEADRWGYLK